ncbi:IS66 family transposase [Acidaminobacter sp. JC074]|uniref:IS66 family transposase n=1 Tax=Acidaminobacter sp. JC074 TaxID=2530199 RepID=UPI001F0F6B6B|nr:IS66 family transposase [Acidaminobacter sp. JC074]MCH4891426.1 IS66 family transposase [Acidaminobacter sp. JC074]
MNTNYTEKHLSELKKDTLVSMYLSLQEITESLRKTSEEQQEQMTQLSKKMDLLMEQLVLANQRQFGRSSEKIELDGQMELCFNEAEFINDTHDVDEPDLLDACVKLKKKKKVKGKREADLQGLPIKVITHEINEKELKKVYGNKWRRLPDEVYKRLAFHPARFEVEEHRVAVYCGTDEQPIIRADRGVDLLRNSIVTPSLQAAIYNSKYVNALPLYRLEQEFKRHDINISRQNMANWTIKCSERYLSLLYDKLQTHLLEHPVLQADETTVEVSKDGRKAGSKSYMWVYRTGKLYGEKPIILYDYQKTRKAEHPREFLKGYSGILVTDGYQVYHTMAKNQENLKVAGCWSHARRKFAEIVKAIGKEKAKGTVAYDALRQIATIYKLDNELSYTSFEDRSKQRVLIVKPQVEAFFAWAKEIISEVPEKSATHSGLKYCINQEEYLKVFINFGDVPLDNNATESVIRGFVIGKKNWQLIDTIYGAQASAIAYSIAETAKANKLKPYEYFKHLLTEIPKLESMNDLEKLDDLLPWSDKLPDICKKKAD